MLRSKTGAAISALVMLAAGIFLFLYPGESLLISARILGGAVLLYGLVGVIGFLIRKEDRSDFKLIFSILIGILGAAILIAPTFIINLFPILTGILILVSGLDTILTGISVKRAGSKLWPLLLLGLLTLGLGALIVANPFKVQATLVRVIGAVLAYCGVVDFIELFQARILGSPSPIEVENA